MTAAPRWARAYLTDLQMLWWILCPYAAVTSRRPVREGAGGRSRWKCRVGCPEHCRMIQGDGGRLRVLRGYCKGAESSRYGCTLWSSSSDAPRRRKPSTRLRPMPWRRLFRSRAGGCLERRHAGRPRVRWSLSRCMCKWAVSRSRGRCVRGRRSRVVPVLSSSPSRLGPRQVG